MTTLTVNLSSALQTTLDQTGVGVWAVYFNGSNVYSTEIDASVGTVAIDLPGDLDGGKVYLLIQSVSSGGIAPLTFGPSGVIQQESDINWQNAASYDFRYDSLELSLEGQAGDAANLTDVNGFGIPMSVQISYPNGAASQTRGYAVNGSSVFSDVDAAASEAVYTYSEGPLANTNRMAASPTTAVSNSLPGYAASDWNAYVESLGDAVAAGTTNPVRIAGYFNGAPSVEWINAPNPTTGVIQAYSYNEYHNPGFYSYTASYANGTFTFTPAANSQIQGVISISAADLANSIYSTLGNATVTDPTTGLPYQFSANSGGTAVLNPYMNTGANDQWGAFFVPLLTGFIGGYMGGTTTAQNSLLGSSSISLSQNWNFDPTFAFGGKIAAGQPGAVTPWSWSGSYGTGVSYDPYAEVFFNNTNSYGNGYSDSLMSQFQQGGPLIPTGYTGTLGNNPFSTTNSSATVTVTDPNASGYDVGDQVTFAGAAVVGDLTIAGTYTIASVGAGSYTITASSNANATTTGGGSTVTFQKDVDSITLTLFDDNETAPSGQTLPDVQGYTPTLIYDTSAGPFVAPLESTGAPNLSLVLNFGLGQMRLDPNATLQIGFYTGTSGGVAQFDYVTIPSSSTQSLYQTWVYSNGAFIASGGAAANGSVLNVNGLPYDTGINWYQIVVTNSAATRTYNLYADAVAGTGVLNPYYNQGGVDQAGSLALDGLAQIPTATLPGSEQYTTSLQIAAFNGGTMSMDPLLLTWITDSSIYSSTPGIWMTPDAPVLGTLTGTDDAFANWGGSTNATPNASLSDVTSGSLAIGWEGSDSTWIGYNASVSNNVIASYTNKVMGLDVALVSFSSASGFTAHNPIVVNADIDGKWTSAASQFGNGTYQAVMTEYQASDTDYSTPVALTSSPLTFTVNMTDLAFAKTGGSFIQLDGSSGNADGNWVRLASTSSTMPNGTLLVYATDLDGNLVGRDGESGAGVTFDEAVLARIGSVATDGGTTMFKGVQSVYLPVGQQLHFAVQTGNDAIQKLPNVLVTGDDMLTVKVAGNFGTLNLTAEVDNTLSATATSAASQRQYDEPWVFLSQGQQATVDIAGSAQNINTIHFVHLDVDRGGNWSVDGVAYGNTDAFRAAVRDNWDAGFVSTGGRGNFQDHFTWAASSGTGFYAPVLVTEGGDIFVIGKANTDGRDHIRLFGENVFGFEDLRADQHSDFDYNDLVMKLSVL